MRPPGALDRLCVEHLGSPAEAVRFSHRSVGTVTGLRLADAREVVVKVHQPRWSRRFLQAVVRGQQAVFTAGLPCPEPLVGPVPVGDALATVEALLEDPGLPTRFGSAERAVSAAGLAAQVAACRDVGGLDGLADHPLRPLVDVLWPVPHSPRFDFAATAAGAEPIDELGAEARCVRDGDDGPAVAGHTDWSARNVRFDAERLRAAYDWDSLALVPESTVVGCAAATWSATAEPGGPAAPGPEEVARYVGDYERARGATLPARSRRAAGGAALYALAYTARCEHALVPPERAPAHLRRARDALAGGADRLLDLPSLL